MGTLKVHAGCNRNLFLIFSPVFALSTVSGSFGFESPLPRILRYRAPQFHFLRLRSILCIREPPVQGVPRSLCHLLKFGSGFIMPEFGPYWPDFFKFLYKLSNRVRETFSFGSRDPEGSEPSRIKPDFLYNFF